MTPALSPSSSPSRRTFLIGAAAVATLAGCGEALGAAPAAAASDPYGDVRDKRREFLTGGSLAATDPALADKRHELDQRADDLIDGFNRESGRTWLWEDQKVGAAGTTAEVAAMGVTADQITELATAWASEGSAHYGDDDLLADLQGALAFLGGQFRADRKRPGNWWFWEIGIPKNVADSLILLGDDAPKDAASTLVEASRFHSPDPNERYGSDLKETGANRVDKALACIGRGVADRDENDIILGRDALSDVEGDGANSLFGLVTSGDGFYADGSFIQHDTLPYSGTYGGVAITGVGEALAMLTGSRWEVTDPDLENLLEAIEKTFAPFQWDARAIDTTRGRAVSRQDERDIDSGFDIASAVLVLADSASKKRRTEYRALVKGWLERTTDRSIAASDQSLAASARSMEVLGDDGLTASPARVGTTNTWNQERIVHHRGDWAAVVSTSSTRIGRYEWGNDENNLGWYQGDGVFYLYHRNDPGQFSDDFWPTVDPYALPGITVNGEERESGLGGGFGTPAAENAYAGGVTVGDAIGTTAMDLANATETLAANKSWFYLSDAVVCLGTGISDDSGTGAQTIVENRAFAQGAVPTVAIDGSDAALGDEPVPGSSVAVTEHAGFVSLPVPDDDAQRFDVSVESRSGTWHDINAGGDTGGDDTTRTRDYVRITQSHPDSGGWYAYAVLPLADRDAVSAAASEPPATVVVAADTAHVISRTGVRMGHFFAEGEHEGYAADGPCAFGVRSTTDRASTEALSADRAADRAADEARTELAIAQPTKAGGDVTLTLPFDAPGNIEAADDSVAVISSEPLTVRVDTDAAAAGAEHRVTFRGALADDGGSGSDADG